MKSVGSYEAKTHLPRLLETVSQGETITITKHGVPVAQLVPFDKTRRKSPQDVVARFRELASRNRLDGLSIRDLIDEGRRY
ncbi:MAG: type II toxin-antitoxin system prevent-host-death family antitoxin [Cyanobacteria bacterium REEB65]|nr:type II toxin-antitoxin system prevent-host-death family antitoxin [Cyanobacteria bacterium REEB65]